MEKGARAGSGPWRDHLVTLLVVQVCGTKFTEVNGSVGPSSAHRIQETFSQSMTGFYQRDGTDPWKTAMQQKYVLRPLEFSGGADWC